MNNQNDIQLLKRCLAGAQGAYKLFYEKYYKYCFTICIRYGIPSREVKDVLQEIFTEIFFSLKNYDPKKAQLKTWLTRVTINRILMHKRKKRIEFKPMESVELERVNIPQQYTIPIEQQIDDGIIFKLLEKMPENYKTVFNLSIVDEYSHREISEILNISEGTSRATLRRARLWAMNTLQGLRVKKKII